MARRQKTIYEKIEDSRTIIAELEKKLKEENTVLDSLLQEKDDMEMRQAWSLLKNNNISVDKLTSILDKSKK